MATDGLMPRVAALLLLLLALALTPRAQAQHCGHAEGEEVLEKLERRFARCLGENAHLEALDKLASAFATNEFDRQAPLALALFSNSSDALDALASVVATSLFDAPPAPHAVQLVDVEELLYANSGERASNYEVKQALRSALAAPLRSCSARSLFVVRNVQALDDAALPVMDVFLDPLNGKRAQFQSGHAVLDCTNAVFLFLFHIGTEPSAEDASGIPINDSLLWTGNGKSTWREFLMRKWTRPVETHSAEEFTPQALVGRITDGITLMTSSLFTAAGDCRIQLSQQDQRSNEASSRNSNGDDQAVQLWTIVLVAVLALLHIIKSWNEVTAQKREQREHREPWGPIKRRKAKQPKAKKK